MPLEPHHNHLFIIEDDTGRQDFVLDQAEYSVGRDSQCDIRLISMFASRHHATLVKQSNPDQTYRYQIVDGSLDGRTSANGILINGRKLQQHLLQHGDEIVFGPGVRATYYMLRREAYETVPPDEFDITLISPNMVGEAERN